MSSTSKLLKENGSLPPPPGSSFNALAPILPAPDVTFAWISVTMGSCAQCTYVPLAGKQRQDMLHIIVWQPNVVSVIDGDTLTTFATFESVEDATPQGMWSITAQLTHLPSQTLAALMGGSIWMTMTSTPLWMTTEGMVCIEPGARMYEGSNVTIFFLSHVFFLVSIVQHPYFHFAPSHEETDHYLLVFLSYSSSFIIPL